MATVELPRVMIAGLAGDSGKTLVSLGLTKILASAGDNVVAFKKGPDFIDAAWLEAASGTPAHNLDTFLMGGETIKQSMGNVSASVRAEVAVIEGNRGLYDGFDAEGSHSTAELAKLTATPVLLVIDVTKVTRTVAALVLGCQKLDPEVPLTGVIINRVATLRQEKLIREAVARATGIEVVGAIPKLTAQHLPSRHLGLVTAMEHGGVSEALQAVASAVRENVDVDAVLKIARAAPPLSYNPPVSKGSLPAGSKVRIGVLRDKAFSFYYPENLSGLEQMGADLVPISPLADSELPNIDGLYAGGGFPEVYAKQLSQNLPFRESLARRIDEGLPVWAECGGLMYLARSLSVAGETYQMVGALPIDVEQTARPQGHGYVRAEVVRENPFIDSGTELRGHEFHYSRLKNRDARLSTVLQLNRGTGVGDSRDGIIARNLVASYLHLHALGTPAWAEGFVRAARKGASA